MSKIDFTQIHVHSYYSLLDGLSSPSDLAEEAQRLGYEYLALTDHGTCAGLYNFQKSCRKFGIKPILGMEAYICPDSLIKSKENNPTSHLILLAKNPKGYDNLIKLSTASYVDGFYSKARIDFNLLEKHREGLIVTSACPSGEISELIYDNKIKEAEELADKYKSVFGEDYYLEIMTHIYFNNDPQQKKERDLANAIYKMSKRLGIKAICTNDVHYSKRELWEAQDILLSVQTLDCLKNPNRMTFNSHDFYLKSQLEMSQLYAMAPCLLSNTMEIAKKIDSKDLIVTGEDLLPPVSRPPEFESDVTWMEALITDGMKHKGLINKPEYRTRVKYEMSVIVKCGYLKYFLILFDLINFANTQGIRIGIGRGCFLPDNKVDCKNGETKEIQYVKVGDSVLSYDGKCHEVIDKMTYDIEEEIIEINMCDGRTITCTSDHKIHVKRGQELVWVKACDLTDNDDIYDIREDN